MFNKIILSKHFTDINWVVVFWDLQGYGRTSWDSSRNKGILSLKKEKFRATPHRSLKDPSDPKDVITVSYHTERGTRLASIHAHDDGSWNEYLSRAGRNSGGGESSSSSAQGATTTDLTWRTNEQTNRAEWWDGTKWVEGDWSDEYQKCIGTTQAATCDPAIRNPSFEEGLSPWDASGGAVLVADSDGSAWGFTATDGTSYMYLPSPRIFLQLTIPSQMESSPTFPNSTITQTLTNFSYDTFTLSYDWNFLVITTHDGPPDTDCTLSAAIGPVTVASWTRKGSVGAVGHVEETMNDSYGTNLTITFGCTDTEFRSGIALDNVTFVGVC
ncbi:hypothetical protein B7494_g5593 [Chlorociboria aeruginascens]|nr:hypothetical protein B7494_g5593 [Chlorociboria aeruginascens]